MTMFGMLCSVQGKVPARWMAVESLSKERYHTHKSDVYVTIQLNLISFVLLYQQVVIRRGSLGNIHLRYAHTCL